MSFTKRYSTLGAALVILSVMVSQCGCGSLGGGSPPPTAANLDSAAVVYQHKSGRPAVVVAPFADPERAVVRMKGIGSGMSDAFSRSLFNDGNIDVLLRPTLSDTAQRLIVGSTGSVPADYQALRQENPQADFLITGQVTDFHHTADFQSGLVNRGLLGDRDEAIVAVDYRVLDLRTGRIIATDHVQGVSKADETPSHKRYENVAFGSFVFWETPLGQASEEAIERMVGHLQQLLPTQQPRLIIAQQTDRRRVRLEVGEVKDVKVGQKYYVCREERGPGELTAVYDPATLQPLQVRIGGVTGQYAEAWLLGQPPEDVSLLGAVLVAELPKPAISTASVSEPVESASP